MTARGLVVSLAVVGCAKSPEVSSGARATFNSRCAPCHGETGRADGPAVPKLPVKPPSFSDSAWQDHVTDDEIRKAIVFGGPAVGKGSAMPAVHELDGTPELDRLVSLVRSFRTR